MPARLPEVSEKVAARLRAMTAEMHPDHHELLRQLADSTIIGEIGKVFYEAIGLGVDNTGEVYNPAPEPSRTSFAGQYQSGVRWSGSRSPRGRRR